ncbi:MAG: TnsA-like heteromeric transposase endonuclease subunit [Mycobacterium sp.]
MGHSAEKASGVSVSYRRADDLSEVAREWAAAGIDELASATPWRTLRWHRGQKHYSGTYWSSTLGSHVIYESRLELARLLFADFDMSVRQIVARPFLLRASADRKPRKHIPDYLWITGYHPCTPPRVPRSPMTTRPPTAPKPKLVAPTANPVQPGIRPARLPNHDQLRPADRLPGLLAESGLSSRNRV